jgi:hypothetical protein
MPRLESMNSQARAAKKMARAARLEMPNRSWVR